MTRAGSFLQTKFLKVKVLLYVWCKFSSFLIKREMATSKYKVLLTWISWTQRPTVYLFHYVSLSGCSSRMWGGRHFLWAPNLREDENLSISVRISLLFWAITRVWGERKNQKNWPCFYLKCRHFFHYGLVWIAFEFLKYCIDIMYCDYWVFNAS